MNKKLTGKALAEFEAERDVWQEVLNGVKEIKAGGGRRKKVEAGRTWLACDSRPASPRQSLRQRSVCRSAPWSSGSKDDASLQVRHRRSLESPSVTRKCCGSEPAGRGVPPVGCCRQIMLGLLDPSADDQEGLLIHTP